MKTSTLLKFCTFILFIFLIGVFVSYRSGAFSKEEDRAPLPPLSSIDTSGKRVIADTISQDSLRLDSFSKLPLMWSSKSIIVTEPEKKPKRTMMENTNPGRIFKRTDTLKFKKDTIMVLKKIQ